MIPSTLIPSFAHLHLHLSTSLSVTFEATGLADGQVSRSRWHQKCDADALCFGYWTVARLCTLCFTLCHRIPTSLNLCTLLAVHLPFHASVTAHRLTP